MAVLLGMVAAAMSAMDTPAVAAGVHVVRIDGTTVTGEWVGSREGHGVELLTADGREVMAFDSLSSIMFDVREDRDSESAGHEPRQDQPRTVFHLADGGRLPGELTERAPDAVVARTALGDAVTLPFDRLAGIQLGSAEAFPRADGVFRSALASPLPGRDVLVTRDADQVKVLRGQLEDLDPGRGSFVFGDRARKFKTDNIYGIVLAAGATRELAQPYPVTVVLRDRSEFSGRVERADADTLRIVTSLGLTAEVAVADVVRMRVRSDRVVYVGDLSPADQHIEGLLHRPWPVRLDGSVSGGPLSINGRPFERGIGVHARTELVFDIRGVYEKFVATIGIDDSVRPRGSVVFRVVGDGETLFDSGEVTGFDAPRHIIVDVNSVKTLTLLVDYGEGLDLADHADWGGARLLRPPIQEDVNAS